MTSNAKRPCILERRLQRIDDLDLDVVDEVLEVNK
jgi:hypothetical protein